MNRTQIALRSSLMKFCPYCEVRVLLSLSYCTVPMLRLGHCSGAHWHQDFRPGLVLKMLRFYPTARSPHPMPNWSPRRFVFYRKAVFPAQRRNQDENRGKRNDPTLVERPGTAFWRERRLRRVFVCVGGGGQRGGKGEHEKVGRG